MLKAVKEVRNGGDFFKLGRAVKAIGGSLGILSHEQQAKVKLQRIFLQTGACLEWHPAPPYLASKSLP